MTISKLMKMIFLPNGSKTRWVKEKSLVASTFSSFHSVFKRLVQKAHKNEDFFGKGFIFCVKFNLSSANAFNLGTGKILSSAERVNLYRAELKFLTITLNGFQSVRLHCIRVLFTELAIEQRKVPRKIRLHTYVQTDLARHYPQYKSMVVKGRIDKFIHFYLSTTRISMQYHP